MITRLDIKQKQNLIKNKAKTQSYVCRKEELDREVVVVWYMNMIWHIVWNSQRIHKGISYKNSGCKNDYLQCKKSLRLKCYNCCSPLKRALYVLLLSTLQVALEMWQLYVLILLLTHTISQEGISWKK